MPRNILLSFLGTTDYVECNYYLEDDHSKQASGVKYVQEAIVDLLCNDFGHDDMLYFFLTEEAAAANWSDDGHQDFKTKEPLPNLGLHARLKNRKLPAQIVPVGIEDGYDTEQIWSIFEQIFSCLQPGDRVIIDITHAFRSLPTLAMTLVTYARALKNIRLRGVYYGAFEALGRPTEVRELPLIDRNAPILNLSAFSELQEWSLAARDFLRFGHAGALAEQARQGGAGFPEAGAGVLDTFSGQLRRLSQGMSTVRGEEIVGGDIFHNLSDSIAHLQRMKLPGPFYPLLEEVKGKISQFYTESNILNGFAGVRWCLAHQLIQQGITLLQEVLISWLIERLNRHGFALNLKDFQDREFIASCLQVFARGEPEENWKKGLAPKKGKERARKIHQYPFVKALAVPFRVLSELRNDINHGGIGSVKPPEVFRVGLESNFAQITRIVQQHS